eukprot:13761143-Ditylum_brightwellii.AAC.1
MEELDEEMTMAMEEAEAEIEEYPNYWWSEKLHKAHLLVEYWRAQISFCQNSIQDEYTLTAKEIEIGPE